jgi:signal transduction histidine kinase
MALIYSHKPKSDLVTQRMWAQLDTRDSRPVTADYQEDGPVAILLHELRSPLASIRNAFFALRSGSKNEAFQQNMHELIERQLRQIELLTSNICQMRGRRLADLQIQRQRIDLCAVLNRAVETVAPEISQRQHKISIDMPECGIRIVGDASRLEEVFVNLLSNASKYSDPGDSIAVSVDVCDGYALVQVVDSGIGIAADSLPHIFDLFVRADCAAVRARSGLGIGLALVRSIVDSHCGTVSATSAGIGQGSRFTVRLMLES